MNRINQLFQNNPKNLLSIYFCAGCPTLEGTADTIRALERNGVSMIEIGIPFSDPMADGVVIQNAATTGTQQDFDSRKQAYFQRIEAMNLRNPRMVGFGISNRQTFEAACAHSSGAIIGSRFVSLLNECEGDAEKAIRLLKEGLER